MNLQRLVLEVDRDDRIESAWLSADPAIKMLSKKLPRSQQSAETAAPAANSGRGLANDMLDPPAYPGMEEGLETIWAQPAPPQRPPGLSGVKTVAEVEEELAEEARQRREMANQQAMPKPPLSPTPQQMLLQQQQQQQLAAAIFQQQQQQQQQAAQTRPMLPFQHPMFLGRGRGINPASLLSPVASMPPQSLSQLLVQQSAALGIPMPPNLPPNLEMLQHLQQLLVQQQQQATLMRNLEAMMPPHPPPPHVSQQQPPHVAQHVGDRRWHGEAAGGDGNFQARQRRFSEHLGPERVGNSEDPFAGLMTRSEKEWLISIHHRQLEVENPFVQDYYYTQFRLKKDLAARGAAIAAGQLPLPPDPLLLLRAPVEIPDEFDDSMSSSQATPYEPSQFANTLGKLTTASVHNPRQVIDARVHRDSAEPDTAETTGEGRDDLRKTSTSGSNPATSASSQERYRRVLLTIENCYSTLLRIQEYDLSIAKILVPNAPSRHVLITDRHRLKQQLMDTVLASESALVDMFRVRKGALLFARMLNKLEVKYVDLCMRSFFKCFPRIRQSPKSLEVLEEVGSDLVKIISASLNNQEGPMMLRNLLFFIWMNTNHAEILSHSLGLSLVLEILNQFASSVKDQEELKQLQIHAEQMAMNLFVLPTERRVRPFSSYFKLLNFMKRHLPEAMRNNFSDQLAFCMTTAADEEASRTPDQTQGEVSNDEEKKRQPPVHDVGPPGLHNPILTSAPSA